MAIEIKKIKKEECDSISKIGVNAFPGGGTTHAGVMEWIESTIEAQNPDDVFNGAFKDEKLVGGTRYINYQMNLLSHKINLGGLGFVCVDLLHKKEKIAKAMLTDFLRHYRAKQVKMVMLYPFSVPFYKKMGFGCGTWMHKFQITPHSFPKGDSKGHLSFATDDDNTLLLECYNRIAAKTNGMIYRERFNLGKDVNLVVYKEGGQIKGYMTFKIEEAKEGYIYHLNLILYGLMYENEKVLREFSTFLNSQADQVKRIIHITQDAALSYFLVDPTNGQYTAFQSRYLDSYASAPGAMYRITDVKGIFQELSGHNFAGEDCRLKLTVRDTFLPENDGSTLIEFAQGIIKSVETDGEYDVEISLDVSDLSSLLVGGINFKGLLKYGLVTISDEGYINTLERIFQNDKPICVTYF